MKRLAPGLAILLVFLFPRMGNSDDGATNRETLRGIKAVHVIVFIGGHEFAAAGVESALVRTDTELNLRRSHIGIVDEAEWGRNPLLRDLLIRLDGRKTVGATPSAFVSQLSRECCSPATPKLLQTRKPGARACPV